MKKTYFFLLFLFFSSLVFSKEVDPIIINNRILVKVNDKAISVIDVMKKMNVFINRYYPHVAESNVLRHQFYASQWRETLSQMIDQELVLIDAEKLELKLSEGDVREKLQERFGPNVVATLEKLGISYEEAKEIIRTELTVQKMTWYRINAKAILSINPQDVKSGYKEFCAEHPPQDEWKYESLSIRSSDPNESESLSAKAFELLNQGKTGLLAVADTLKQKQEEVSKVSISVSEEFCVQDKDLSASHKNVLLSLNPDEYSKPIPQVSKIGNQIVHRIFHLKEHIKKQPPSFEEISNQIEENLVQKAIEQQSLLYLQKLRDNEKIQESIPADFQPFVMGDELVQTY
jgi:hypothetical protein